MRLSKQYPDFWAIFKIADATKRDLFSASRIGPVNYFARPAGISGANFVAGLTRIGALVQCEVMFNTRKADRKVLLQLASAIEEKRDQILSTLGPDYTLERAEHALSLRRQVNNQGNILLKQSWEPLAESLVTEIYRVYDVMSPLIEDALVELRAPEDKKSEDPSGDPQTRERQNRVPTKMMSIDDLSEEHAGVSHEVTQ